MRVRYVRAPVHVSPPSMSHAIEITEPPPRPTSFLRGEFLPPPHFEKPLSRQFPHARDARIHFDEIPHIYYVDGKAVGTSVTSLKHGYFGTFDADMVIRRMMNGANWYSNEKYRKPNGDMMTAAEIKEQWDLNGQLASNKGTWMHWNIELCLNGLPFNAEDPELHQFARFRNEVMRARSWSPYRTEWEIFAEPEDVAGSIDAIMRCDADGSFAIVDWKRSVKLADLARKADPARARKVYDYDDVRASLQRRRAKGPLATLPDDTIIEYYVQLNLYRWMLQRYYDMRISAMCLVCLHENESDYIVFDAPVLEAECDAIMALRRASRHGGAAAPAAHDASAAAPDAPAAHNASAAAHDASAAAAAAPDAPDAPAPSISAARVRVIQQRDVDSELTRTSRLLAAADGGGGGEGDDDGGGAGVRGEGRM